MSANLLDERMLLERIATALEKQNAMTERELGRMAQALELQADQTLVALELNRSILDRIPNLQVKNPPQVAPRICIFPIWNKDGCCPSGYQVAINGKIEPMFWPDYEGAVQRKQDLERSLAP